MKLVSLSGNSKVNGLDQFLTIDPKKLDPAERGIYNLAAIVRIFPEITWGQLMKMFNKKNNMLGESDFWEKTGNFFGDIKDGIGDGVGLMARAGGDTIRLLTDKKVKDGLVSYGAAYATGGSSLGLESLFGGLFGAEQGKQIAEKFGGAMKDPIVWIIGGVGVIALIFLLTSGSKGQAVNYVPATK